MARNAHKPRPKADPVDPTDHAHNPDRQDGVHPSAAPLGTDEEAGRPAPRRGAANDSDVFEVDSTGEVRAGPGDAGMQSAPRVLDNPRDAPKRGGRPLFFVLLLLPVAIALIWILIVNL